MTRPDKEQDQGVIQARPHTPEDNGGSLSWIYSERGWLALIITSTAAVLLFSVYCLSQGITIIFMHLFYFPIVLLVYRYRYRGFIPAVLLSLIYVALVYFYDPGQPGVITGAWYRFLVFVGIAAVVAYLSEQLKNGQKALEESERKLKLHVDFSSDWEFWIDTRGDFVYITPSCTVITGYTPEEFYADPLTMIRLIHPDDRAAFTRHIDTYLSQSGSSSFEFRIIRKDGQTRWIEHVCQAMFDLQGILIGRRGTNRDITERRGLEGQLRLQNQIFETIAEGINLVRTDDGVIVYTNSKFDRMFGYEKGELAGRHVSVVNAPDEKMSPRDTAREITSVLNTQGAWRGELKNIRKDGTVFWCLVVISSFNHPEFGNVWISAHTDINARKLAEEAVNAAVTLSSRIDTMSVGECMSYTLDEAERLTTSRIGFFHFVNESEKTIQLIAWSTETKKHCVIPKDPEQQYPVEKAGVWVDCLRQRKAVIHNDYASLPHKKSLPEGHVPLTRELVVPIFDADRIVAIIGVGNKETDYDDRDTSIISLLAKNAWTLIQRKRAEEELKESERKFREIFNNINDGIELHEMMDNGLPGKYREVNEVTCRMLGYSREELLQHSPLDFTTEYHNRPIEDIGKEIITRGHSRFETGHRNRDGTVIPVEINAHVIRHDSKTLVLSVVRDITERKKAEDAILKSGREWQTTFNAITDAVFLLDDKGRIIRHNRAFETCTGKPADEIDGRYCFEIMHDTTYPLEGCPMEKAKKSRQRESLELKIGNRWFVAAVDPVFSGNGEISGGVHLLIDITERKLTEDALRQSEERFRTLSETSLTGIYIFLDGVIRYVNPMFARMYGYTPEEMVGMDPMIFVYPEDRALVREKMQGRLDHREEISVYECRIVKRDGRTIHVSIMGAVIPFQGRPAIAGNMLDITERKRAEQALRESEERYRILFDASPISLWEEDFSDIRYWLDERKEEGVNDFRSYFETHPEDVLSSIRMVKVTRINHASMALFGAHSLQELSGSISSVFTPESYDTFREELIAVSMGKTGFECEVPVQTVSGERKVTVLKMIVVPGFEQTLGKVVISFLDITERKKMEDALKEANRKITMLSSITRHDIKNQLLALRGFLGLSQMNTRDPELLGFMEKEERAAEAISNQIEFTKFYEDIGVKAPEWQDISHLVLSARSQLHQIEKIEVIIDLPPVKVFADSLIGKVFYNLMENTLRHGEHVSRIRFSFYETVSGAEIVYEDNGVGISAEDKQHLFQKGFGKNTGLGLFLSQEILAITRLSIREEGEPGKGVRFVIAVPKGGYRLAANS
ncbi:MAG: PAS domain S-box protein [Methanoregula sp.]|jgi:PAS domain S-box-containing protein